MKLAALAKEARDSLFELTPQDRQARRAVESLIARLDKELGALPYVAPTPLPPGGLLGEALDALEGMLAEGWKDASKLAAARIVLEKAGRR